MRFLLAATIMSAAVILARVAWGAPTKPAPGEVVPWQAIFQAVDGARWIDRAAQVEAAFRLDLGGPGDPPGHWGRPSSNRRPGRNGPSRPPPAPRIRTPSSRPRTAT